MSSETTWQAEYKVEIAHALAARSKGNEGMARVCARRAAGIIVGEYLLRRGFLNLTTSAFDRLTLFNSLPEVDDHLKAIACHFLLRVNNDHTLPVAADLVDEAQWLANRLLLENRD